MGLAVLMKRFLIPSDTRHGEVEFCQVLKPLQDLNVEFETLSLGGSGEGEAVVVKHAHLDDVPVLILDDSSFVHQLVVDGGTHREFQYPTLKIIVWRF